MTKSDKRFIKMAIVVVAFAILMTVNQWFAIPYAVSALTLVGWTMLSQSKDLK